MAAYQPSSFLRLYSSLSLKTPKRTRPIFGHLGRTSLVNQGFIIRDGNWIRNASRKCFWDCYWRCASQLLGTLRSNDADGNENVEKTIGLISKTTNSHVHQTFCTFLSRFCTTTAWKCLVSRLKEDVNKERRNFISLSELGYGHLKFSFRRVRLHLTKWGGRNNRYIDWKNANSH